MYLSINNVIILRYANYSMILHITSFENDGICTQLIDCNHESYVLGVVYKTSVDKMLDKISRNFYHAGKYGNSELNK